MEEMNWTDRVRNEKVLHTVKEERNILHNKKRLIEFVTSFVRTVL